MTKNDDPLHWPEDRHLTRDEAARFARALGFRLSVATLAKYAVVGTGPVITFFGARPFYKLVDLRDWLRSRIRRSRSTMPRPPCKSDAVTSDVADE
jgi:hypothetical protein